MSGVLWVEWSGKIDGEYATINRWDDNSGAFVSIDGIGVFPIHCLISRWRKRKYEPPFLVLSPGSTDSHNREEHGDGKG